MKKRLLLLGGGHAHLHVLKSLTERYLPEAEVTLVSTFPQQVYSGMLPGWIAGHYQLEQCTVPLRPLAERADVAFIEKSARRIDFSTRTVICDDGSAVPFDTVSIDTGPVADLSMISGAAEHAVSVRPIEAFIDAVAAIKASVESGRTRRIVFVGAGAGGIELALALQHALAAHAVGITLISASDTLPAGAAVRLARILRTRGISILAGQVVARIGANEVHLQSGTVVEADHIIVATGASAAAWPKASGLACDERGFILVNEHLQSVSHPDVFAAGDCASMKDHPRPKSGVYAVRAGPVLAHNLRAFCEGRALKAWTPQTHALYLISTGDRFALATWGAWSWSGGWVWRWKDRIDRRFMRRFGAPG